MNPNQAFHVLYELAGYQALIALVWGLVFVVLYKLFIKGR